jgi:hypothetical protein
MTSQAVLRLREKAWLEEDLIGRDSLESECFENLSAVDVAEQIERGLIPKRWARVAVDMGHHEVDIGLHQPIKGCAFGQDHADELMVALDAGFLVGRTRIAVEDSCSEFSSGSDL